MGTPKPRGPRELPHWTTSPVRDPNVTNTRKAMMSVVDMLGEIDMGVSSGRHYFELGRPPAAALYVHDAAELCQKATDVLKALEDGLMRMSVEWDGNKPKLFVS